MDQPSFAVAPTVVPPMPTGRTRIAFFSEAVPPIHDGVCRALSNLSTYFDAQGTPYLIVSGTSPSPDLAWRRSVHKVLSVPFPLYRYYRLAVPFAPALDATLDRFQPDILHIANPSLLGLYALSYGRRRRIPVVSSYHTNFVSYFPYYRLGELQGLGWLLLRWFHSHFRTTYVPSRSTMLELKGRGIPRLSLWPRGVDLRQFNPDYRSPDLRRSIGVNGEPILLYVGRLVREKDLGDLAAAVDILGRNGLRFKTVIVGDGPLRKQLQSRMPDAHFTGYQTGLDLSRWYASADVFLFPSTTETFGNVILEAFASGLPVLGVRAGGSIDLIQPGKNGLLAEPNNPLDLAEKARRILAGRDEFAEMRRGALQTVRNFDWNEVNRGLTSSYDHIIHEYHRAVAEPAMELAAG